MLRTSLVLLAHVRRSSSHCPLGRAHLATTQRGPLHLSARAFSSTSANAAHACESNSSNSHNTSALLDALDACIAQRKCAQALVTLQEIESNTAVSSSRPSVQTLQKLAILLAKQKSTLYTQHAYELLLSVYRCAPLALYLHSHQHTQSHG